MSTGPEVDARTQAMVKHGAVGDAPQPALLLPTGPTKYIAETNWPSRITNTNSNKPLRLISPTDCS